MTLSLDSKRRLTVVLVLVFAANFLETAVDASLQALTAPGLAQRIGAGFLAMEPAFLFDGHEHAEPFAIWGFSLVYFIGFPVVVALMLRAAYRRSTEAYRSVVLSIAWAYLLSLPFYLAFPVPERWWIPESQATLLPNRASGALIAAIRPLSGINNSFPSFHASVSTALALLAQQGQFQFRYSLTLVCIAVVLSTFVLGIHWLADIVAGVMIGVLSVVLTVAIGPGRQSVASLAESRK
jgi:membrane-associated phospholipid phosphatase